MSAVDFVGRADPGQTIWYLPTGEPITTHSILNRVSSIRLRSGLSRKRVALGNLSPLDYVTAIVALDGFADTLLFLPEEETNEQQQVRANAFGVDALLDGPLDGAISRHAMPNAGLTAPVHTRWLLPTSGTTAAPKLIEHDFASLTRTLSQHLQGNKYVWGSLYSLRRFAGIQVLLQALVAASPLILRDDRQQLAEFITCLRAIGCNALSGTPSAWRQLSMSPHFDALASKLQQITLGGEIVDQQILDVLSARAPGSKIVHIYASTEIGVGFSVRDRKAGFPADYLSASGRPCGLQMKIASNGHLYFAKQQEETEQPTWQDSGDLVRREGNRVFFVGRSNGSINVGGSKVMPEEVEAVLLERPEVSFVEIRGRRSAFLGSVVEAAVVLTEGIELNNELKRTLISHCQSRLDPYKVPAIFVQMNEIPLTANGKRARSTQA